MHFLDLLLILQLDVIAGSQLSSLRHDTSLLELTDALFSSQLLGLQIGLALGTLAIHLQLTVGR